MLCKNCGQQVSESENFCSNCGCKINIIEAKYNIYNSFEDPDLNIPIIEVPAVNEVCINKNKNNLYAWIMALIPIFGGIIEIALGFGRIYLWLNIIFGCIDENSLAKQGIDTSEFGFAAAFLVPFYLYKRAKVLNDGYSYFIAWCILFVLTLFI